MASYDAAINIIIKNQQALSKLTKDLSDVQEKIDRIAVQAIPQIRVELDKSQVDKQLALISQQFRRRDYRLQVNDTTIKTATLNAEKLKNSLDEISSKKYVIDVQYSEKGGRPPTTAAEIGRRAKEARSQGSSQKLMDILSAAEVAVGDVSNYAKITALLSKVSKSSAGTVGFNMPGLREVIKSLGGTPIESRTRAPLQKQAQELIQSVDSSVIDAVYDRLIDLKMQLRPIRGQQGTSAPRSMPNLNRMLDQIANLTENPRAAQRMLRMMPEASIQQIHGLEKLAMELRILLQKQVFLLLLALSACCRLLAKHPAR